MRVLRTLIVLICLAVFANAQTESESLFVLKGKIINGKFQTNEVVKIFFEDKDQSYQTKVNVDGAFEIKIPNGIYQVKIVVTNIGSEVYQFKKTNIENSELITFDVKKADSVIVACPIVELPEVFIETKDIILSNEIILKPLESLPKAQNKTKGKTINN